MRESISLGLLVPLRLFTGWTLARAGLSKAMGGWLHEGKLTNSVSGWLTAGKPYPFYAPFLRHVVLPHAKLFSFLIASGELSVGVALLLGLFTRPAAFFGFLLVLAILLGQGDPLGANVTCAFCAILLTLLLTAPGRVLGLDAALRGRVPRWLS
jgi:thiosulfate dehydrogenase [quinone] large subunit